MKVNKGKLITNNYLRRLVSQILVKTTCLYVHLLFFVLFSPPGNIALSQFALLCLASLYCSAQRLWLSFMTSSYLTVI